MFSQSCLIVFICRVNLFKWFSSHWWRHIRVLYFSFQPKWLVFLTLNFNLNFELELELELNLNLIPKLNGTWIELDFFLNFVFIYFIYLFSYLLIFFFVFFFEFFFWFFFWICCWFFLIFFSLIHLLTQKRGVHSCLLVIFGMIRDGEVFYRFCGKEHDPKKISELSRSWSNAVFIY